MKQAFAENKLLALLLGILSFVLLGAFYYYGIYPKASEQDNLERSIVQLEQQSAVLEERVIMLSKEEASGEDDFELRKKLPINRELDQLLRSLNEIELVSDSKIMGITFNNYDDEVAKSTNLVATEEEFDEEADKEGPDEAENEASEDEEEEKPVTQIDITTLPPDLKLITLSVDMMTLDEEHLMQFLQELEDVTRVIRIDSVDINQPGEAELTLKDPDERISVTVQLTTFFTAS